MRDDKLAIQLTFGSWMMLTQYIDRAASQSINRPVNQFNLA